MRRRISNTRLIVDKTNAIDAFINTYINNRAIICNRRKYLHMGRFFYLAEYVPRYLHLQQCTYCLFIGKAGKVHGHLFYGSAAPGSFLFIVFVLWPVSYFLFRKYFGAVDGLIRLTTVYLAILHFASVISSWKTKSFHNFKVFVQKLEMIHK